MKGVYMDIKTLTGGPIDVNTYIISNDRHEAVIIDPCDPRLICSYLRSASLVPKAILLTHAHFDHIWGLDGILGTYKDLPVYLHKDDFGIMCDPDKNMAVVIGVSPDESRFSFSDPIQVSDGGIIEISDMRFEVIHTPGHTAGCVCYRIGDILFTGDTLFRHSAGRVDCYNSDPSQMAQSMKKMSGLCGNLKIYPGHGPTSDLYHEKKFNPFLTEE